MISYGPNNTVSVESAVVLRRVTSADAPTLRPATAEQLSARASLLPRPRLSADVQRRRELLHTFQQTVVEPTVSGTKSLNKYQRSVPLSQFGVDLVSAATSAPPIRGQRTVNNGQRRSSVSFVPIVSFRSSHATAALCGGAAGGGVLQYHGKSITGAPAAEPVPTAPAGTGKTPTASGCGRGHGGERIVTEEGNS